MAENMPLRIIVEKTCYGGLNCFIDVKSDSEKLINVVYDALDDFDFSTRDEIELVQHIYDSLRKYFDVDYFDVTITFVYSPPYKFRIVFEIPDEEFDVWIDPSLV